jgi:hypothetical protein
LGMSKVIFRKTDLGVYTGDLSDPN